MKKGILWMLMSFLLVAALVLASCAPAVPGEQEEEEEEEEEEEPVELPQKIFKVGQLSPTTGALSGLGLACHYGAQLAADHINDDGGFVVDGQRYIIEYTHFDTRGDPKVAVAGAIKLVEEGNHLIINWAVSAIMAVRDITEAAGVVTVAPGYPGEYTVGTRYQFAESLVDWLGEFYRDGMSPLGMETERTMFTGVDTLAILTEEGYAQSLDILDDFLARNEALGGVIEIVYNELFPPGMVDFTSVIAAIRAADPDLVLFIMFAQPETLVIYSQMAEMGYTPQWLAMDPIVSRGPEAKMLATGAADGIVEFMWYIPHWMDAPEWAIEAIGFSPERRDRYNRDMIARHGVEWEVGLAALTYDFLAGMVHMAALSVDPLDSDAFVDAIHTETPFYGAGSRKIWQKEISRNIMPLLWVVLRDIDVETGSFNMDYLGGGLSLDHWVDTEYFDRAVWEWEVEKVINVKEEPRRLE